MSLLALKIAFAGLLITEDMKVEGIDFNGGKTQMTIKKGSSAEYFFVSQGIFEVTNIESENGFNVASKNKEVKTILLKDKNHNIISCVENENPGETVLHINHLKGKYQIIPSKKETCNQNEDKTANAVLTSFWDDMSSEQKQELILELGKIALIIFIGQSL